jgi:hypothetical protein
MSNRTARFFVGALSILALAGGVAVALWDSVYVGHFTWKMWLIAAVVVAIVLRYWLLNSGSEQPRLFSWRQGFSLAAAICLLIYFTQALWIVPLAPVLKHFARDPQVKPSVRKALWQFVARSAMQTKDPQALLELGNEADAPGELRANAWAALAQRHDQSGDSNKAGECYLSALECLVSDPGLTSQGLVLRDTVWKQLRFQLGTVIDRQRYQKALASWAERTTDQQALQQLMFELGKMKVLAGIEPRGSGAEVNR